jgi:hypothetical protein
VRKEGAFAGHLGGPVSLRTALPAAMPPLQAAFRSSSHALHHEDGKSLVSITEARLVVDFDRRDGRASKAFSRRYQCRAGRIRVSGHCGRHANQYCATPKRKLSHEGTPQTVAMQARLALQ